MILTESDYVIALDISSKTGVAEGWAKDRPVLTTEEFTQSDDDSSYERAMGRSLVWISKRLAPSCPLPRPTVAVIEGSQNNSFQGDTQWRTTRMMLGLLGVFTGAFRAKDIPIFVPGVSTLRKTFLGKGNLPGPVAKRQAKAMCRLLGWPFPDDNAADAAAAWAHHVMQFPVGTQLAVRHRLLLKDLPLEPGTGGQAGARKPRGGFRR